MVRDDEQAATKENVRDALHQAVEKLRAKLGESLAMVQKFDTPPGMASTPSLEAWKAYSQGRSHLHDPECIPLFQHAIELDPNFAMAHLSLGICLSGQGQPRAQDSFRTAFRLRERASEWEKYAIESRYYFSVVGDEVAARSVYAAWVHTYPRDSEPALSNMAAIDQVAGQYQQALDEALQDTQLYPTKPDPYMRLAHSYVLSNQPEQVRTLASQKQDFTNRHMRLYQAAFLLGDAAGMAHEAAWSKGKPDEQVFLSMEADTAAYSGMLGKAREFSGRAAAFAVKERVAQSETAAALREAVFGNTAEARKGAASALALSGAEDIQSGAALALALAGDLARSQTLADDLAKRFPQHTLVRLNYLPEIRAQLALGRKDPATAIKALVDALPYELGIAMPPGPAPPRLALYPVYIRGQAYLAAHQGGEAGDEFQKILDHPGVVLNEPIGALAHLGLARAYAMRGDVPKARSTYQDFLTLWKGADPEVPVLKQAQAELKQLK